MADRDIRPFNASGEGREGYYVQRHSGSFGGPYLRYVVIDAYGAVEDTPVCADFDEAAMTLEEAVIHHLTENGALGRAEAQLERRRRELKTNAPPAPVPDLPTQKFLDDDAVEDWS